MLKIFTSIIGTGNSLRSAHSDRHFCLARCKAQGVVFQKVGHMGLDVGCVALAHRTSQSSPLTEQRTVELSMCW